MSIIQILETAVITGLVFAAIDFVWLTTVAKKFYYDRLGHLLRKKADLAAAVVFYILYIVGLLYFAVVPAINEGSAGMAAQNGALYGLFTYATYDLTNLATVKGWSKQVTVIDIIWGTVLSGTTALAAFSIMRFII